MKRKSASKILVSIVLFFFVILPFLLMITNIRMSDIVALFNSPNFGVVVFNSLFIAITASFLSVGIAFVLSMIVNRSNIKYKGLFKVLLTVPMLIPSIAHGFGLILLLGNRGIITNFLNIEINLFGFLGVILGSILYSFPVAFLLLNDAFQYEDYSSYEVADVLGISKLRQLINITLPNISKALISTFFAVFTMTFTDYGVPLVVGGKIQTLSTYMYREVIGLLNFNSGAVVGLLLLIPAFIAFIIDYRTMESSGASTVKKEFSIKNNKTRDVISYIVMITSVVIVFTPIVAFTYLSFVKMFPLDLSFSLKHVKLAVDFGLLEYLLNSLAIAFVAASVGVVISYFTAYLTARSKKDYSVFFLHLISLISLAFPGVVLGLSYVLFFNGTILYGTIYILIIVNIVHFFASPYLMAYNALRNFSGNFEDVASTLNISNFRMIVDVYVPSTINTVLEMFSYYFINSMVTISAVSFLSNLKTMPLALLIPQFDAQSLIEPTAFIAVVIFVVNVVVKVSIYTAQKISAKGAS